MNCWAKNISTCCSIQSSEHYVSQGLFADKNLIVSGFPFLNGKTKILGKSSLTRNCLCKKHNELLSPYDAEAIKFGASLEYASNLSQKRRHQTSEKFRIHNKKVDQDKFCRWLIKTYIGFSIFFKYPSIIPLEHLAELVFATGPTYNHVRIILNMSENEEFQISQTVTVSPLEFQTHTIGILIKIYGIRLQCIFSSKPNFREKSPRLIFEEYPKRKSCIIEFTKYQ